MRRERRGQSAADDGDDRRTTGATTDDRRSDQRRPPAPRQGGDGCVTSARRRIRQHRRALRPRADVAHAGADDRTRVRGGPERRAGQPDATGGRRQRPALFWIPDRRGARRCLTLARVRRPDHWTLTRDARAIDAPRVTLADLLVSTALLGLTAGATVITLEQGQRVWAVGARARGGAAERARPRSPGWSPSCARPGRGTAATRCRRSRWPSPRDSCCISIATATAPSPARRRRSRGCSPATSCAATPAAAPSPSSTPCASLTFAYFDADGAPHERSGRRPPRRHHARDRRRPHAHLGHAGLGATLTTDVALRNRVSRAALESRREHASCSRSCCSPSPRARPCRSPGARSCCSSPRARRRRWASTPIRAS